MAKIYAPNKEYNGISASVTFVKGVGETDSPALLEWFKKHGYEVEEPEKAERQELDTEEPQKAAGNGQQEETAEKPVKKGK